MPLKAPLVVVLFLSGCGHEEAACHQAVKRYAIEIQEGASVRGAEFSDGRQAYCARRRVQEAVNPAAKALELLPKSQRPSLKLVLNPKLISGPPIDGLEVHRSGALLVENPPRDTTLWLHEFFHVLAGHPSTTQPALTRIVRAAEEGAADFFSATFARDPRLGAVDRREIRDLSRNPNLREGSWALLIGGRLDPHALGLGLAHQLWKRYPSEPGLALALAKCFREAEKAGPLEKLTELPAFCPRQWRTAFSVSLDAWMRPGSSTTRPEAS